MLLVGIKVEVDALLVGLDPVGTEDDSLEVDGSCVGSTGISCEVCVVPAALDAPEALAGSTEVSASELVLGDAGTVGLELDPEEELIKAGCDVKDCAESVWLTLAEAAFGDAAWVLELLVDCEDTALGIVVASAEDNDEGKL